MILIKKLELQVPYDIICDQNINHNVLWWGKGKHSLNTVSQFLNQLISKREFTDKLYENSKKKVINWKFFDP